MEVLLYHSVVAVIVINAFLLPVVGSGLLLCDLCSLVWLIFILGIKRVAWVEMVFLQAVWVLLMSDFPQHSPNRTILNQLIDMWQHAQIHVLACIANCQVILFQTQSIHFKIDKCPYWFFQLMGCFLTHLFTDSSSFWVQGGLTTICLPLNSKLQGSWFWPFAPLVLPTPVSASEDFTYFLVNSPTQLGFFSL